MTKLESREDIYNAVSKECVVDKIWSDSVCGIAYIEENGNFIDVNPSFCRITGYTRIELIDKTFQEITHPDDLEADVESSNDVAVGNMDSYVMIKRYISKHNKIVWVNLTVEGLYKDKEFVCFFVQVFQINLSNGHFHAIKDAVANEASKREKEEIDSLKVEERLVRYIRKNWKMICIVLTFIGTSSINLYSFAQGERDRLSSVERSVENIIREQENISNSLEEIKDILKEQ